MPDLVLATTTEQVNRHPFTTVNERAASPGRRRGRGAFGGNFQSGTEQALNININNNDAALGRKLSECKRKQKSR